jgi:hypothetical protein
LWLAEAELGDERARADRASQQVSPATTTATATATTTTTTT